MSKSISTEKVKDTIHYLLTDWKANIKNFNIVVGDILTRIDKVKLPKSYKQKRLTSHDTGIRYDRGK